MKQTVFLIRGKHRIFWLFFIFLLKQTTFVRSQTTSNNQFSQKYLSIFLDCSYCEGDYVRAQINFVNFVRDFKEADVRILVTAQTTGSGGNKYILFFTGQKSFSGKSDTLFYTSKSDATQDDIRKGIVQKIKIGLVAYIAKTPFADKLLIESAGTTTADTIVTIPVKDKWNSWVFTNSFNGSINNQQSEGSSSYSGYVSAVRITTASKINLSVNSTYNESNYSIAGIEIYTYTNNQNFSGLYVKSISKHLSLGGTETATVSSFDNINFSSQIAPAIEYDIFPYSQSVNKEFLLLYSIYQSDNYYADTTIYNQIHEILYGESLTTTIQFVQKWGSFSASLVGSHYFEDFTKNHLTFSSSLSVRVFEGFSISFYGSTSLIHDQLSLPKSGASADEILLQQKEIATSYSYSTSIGISYTFGSIYNNVVNPRF